MQTELWTRHCNVCQYDNGGRLHGDNYPNWDTTDKLHDGCVACKSADVVWKRIDEDPGDNFERSMQSSPSEHGKQN